MWEELDFVVLRENTFSCGNFERKFYSRHLVCYGDLYGDMFR